MDHAKVIRDSCSYVSCQGANIAPYNHVKNLERCAVDIFGLEINADSHTVMSILFISGFTFGCLITRGNIFFKFLVLAIYVSLFQWLIHANLWFVFAPFLMGVFIANAKSLRKIFTLFRLDKKTE